MAKLLPCKNCGHARTPPNERFPGGEPMAVGRVAGFPLLYKCSGCKAARQIGARDFARLSDLSPQDLERLGFLTPPS